jgi:hypothetical protein
MDRAVIWLIKHTVWQQAGVWLGAEMRHDQIFLYDDVRPLKQRWRGAGNLYGKCHRQPDELSILYGHRFTY